MKKHVDTPGAEAPHQIIEPGSDWVIPSGPIRIFTALDETRFLCSPAGGGEVFFSSNDGNILRFWAVIGTLPHVQIFLYPFLNCLTLVSETEISALLNTGAPNQWWDLQYAGKDRVCIGENKYAGKFLHVINANEGSKLALVDRFHGSQNQVFKLGAGG